MRTSIRFKLGDLLVWSINPPAPWSRAKLENKYGGGLFHVSKEGTTDMQLKELRGDWNQDFFQPASK
jgi:hypothetical protein